MLKQKSPTKILLPSRFARLPQPVVHKDLAQALATYFSGNLQNRSTVRELSHMIEREILLGNVPKPLRPQLREFVWTEGSQLSDEITARRMVGLPEIH